MLAFSMLAVHVQVLPYSDTCLCSVMKSRLRSASLRGRPGSTQFSTCSYAWALLREDNRVKDSGASPKPTSHKRFKTNTGAFLGEDNLWLKIWR